MKLIQIIKSIFGNSPEPSVSPEVCKPPAIKPPIKPPISKEVDLPDHVGEDYSRGATIEEVAAAHGASAYFVRRKLVSLGVKIRNRNSPTYRLWLSATQRKLIAELCQRKDVTLMDIGVACGASRAVVQGAVDAPGKLNRCKKFKPGPPKKHANSSWTHGDVAIMWRGEASNQEISGITGWPVRQVPSRISGLRSEYPALFPYRRQPRKKVGGASCQG